jgi:SAM-dependent methyltransferase
MQFGQRSIGVWIGATLAIVFASLPGCTAEQPTVPVVHVKVLLPLEDLDGSGKIVADGREFAGKGTERTIAVPKKADATHVVIADSWEPNNYTKITRTRKVAWSTSPMIVDLRKASDVEGEKDEIVVRWVPTPVEAAEAMCRLGRVTPEDVVYDLGCGDGIMVFTAVEKFNARRGVGVDLDKDLILKCTNKARDLGLKDRFDFRVGDVLKVEDLSDASVVLLYMGDDINKRLQPILKKTLKPGSRVVSHRFLMDTDWPPDQSERLNVKGEVIDIHLWEIKGG